MQQVVTIKVLPSVAVHNQQLREKLAEACGQDQDSITGFIIQRRSIDARSKTPHFILQCLVFINEPFIERQRIDVELKDVRFASKTVFIAGAGPAGLFAAIRLIEKGIRPIILERGKDVRARRRDLARMNKEGEVNPESNYCFGEGGAGTYSDGKLYTRSTKRGDINRILNLLVQFGADENILYDAHPHIGTNKLPQIITSMREKIIDCGGEVRFEEKLIDLEITNGRLEALIINSGRVECRDLILATGHSARDIFELLNKKGVHLFFKPFALGVRIEHPQEVIDQIQYHCLQRSPHLPPASYSVVEQVSGRGVFSFCMCPGGIIAPAATDHNEIVVNGWSPSKRNNPFANSGIVVTIEEKDVTSFAAKGPLAGMYFQREVERQAFARGGGKLMAPAQRLTDYINNTLSSSLPDCSYLPGIQSAQMSEVLPPFVQERLQQAFLGFGKKMKGYITEEAVVVATESRTSSPVRIPRDPGTMQHPQVSGLYPCGEGAGYAGGIVSAAMDGERVADHI